ncbi:hypothetical protein CNY67_15415 [Desulfovibrio sp. G11]|nr:hypothetical protein CNY67_15415 [Desulfovibrio sp. G11]
MIFSGFMSRVPSMALNALAMAWYSAYTVARMALISTLTLSTLSTRVCFFSARIRTFDCSIMLSNWVRTEIKYGIARATDINISANNPVT